MARRFLADVNVISFPFRASLRISTYESEINNMVFLYSQVQLRSLSLSLICQKFSKRLSANWQKFLTRKRNELGREQREDDSLAHNKLSQLLWNDWLLLLAERDVATHEPHVQGLHVRWRLLTVLVHVCDVLGQSQVIVSIWPVLYEPQQVEARKEGCRKLNVLFHRATRVVPSKSRVCCRQNADSCIQTSHDPCLQQDSTCSNAKSFIQHQTGSTRLWNAAAMDTKCSSNWKKDQCVQTLPPTHIHFIKPSTSVQELPGSNFDQATRSLLYMNFLDTFLIFHVHTAIFCKPLPTHHAWPPSWHLVLHKVCYENSIINKITN